MSQRKSIVTDEDRINLYKAIQFFESETLHNKLPRSLRKILRNLELDLYGATEITTKRNWSPITG